MPAATRVNRFSGLSLIALLLFSLPAYAQQAICDGEFRLVANGIDMPYDEFEYYLNIHGAVLKCSPRKYSDYTERGANFDCDRNFSLYVENFPTEAYLLNGDRRTRLTTNKVFSLVSAEPFPILTLASRLDSRGHYLDRQIFAFRSASPAKSIYSGDCRLKFDEYRFNFSGESKEDVVFEFRFMQNIRRVVNLGGVQDGLYVYDPDKKSLSIDDWIQVKGGQVERHSGDPWQSGGAYEVLNVTQILYRSANGSVVYTLDPTRAHALD